MSVLVDDVAEVQGESDWSVNALYMLTALDCWLHAYAAMWHILQYYTNLHVRSRDWVRISCQFALRSHDLS